jgi:hypothetical protein
MECQIAMNKLTLIPSSGNSCYKKNVRWTRRVWDINDWHSGESCYHVHDEEQIFLYLGLYQSRWADILIDRILKFLQRKGLSNFAMTRAKPSAAEVKEQIRMGQSRWGVKSW